MSSEIPPQGFLNASGFLRGACESAVPLHPVSGWVQNSEPHPNSPSAPLSVLGTGLGTPSLSHLESVERRRWGRHRGKRDAVRGTRCG